MSLILFKGAFLGFLFHDAGRDDSRRLVVFIVFLLCNVLPNLILALVSLMCVTGYNKTFLKVLIGYPVLWALPIFSPFVMGPKNISCCSDAEFVTRSFQIGVSKRLSIMNIFVSMIMCVISFLLLFSPLMTGLVASMVFFVPIIIFLFTGCTSLWDHTNFFRNVTIDGQIIDSGPLDENI